MALLDHLADMDRFLRLYAFQKPIRVSRESRDSKTPAEMFRWFPETPYTPANPGSADDRFISEVKSILDQLWAFDPEPLPIAPESWTAVYGLKTITVTHATTTTSAVEGDTITVYTGTIKVALEYYLTHGTPPLEIIMSPERGAALSLSDRSIQIDPFEAIHAFSATTTEKNLSGLCTLVHELGHAFLKATMATTGLQEALREIKEDIHSSQKPATQSIPDYQESLEHDIVMHYYEIPAARAFRHAERVKYSNQMGIGAIGLLKRIWESRGLPSEITQPSQCPYDVVYWAEDSSGQPCTEMVPEPNGSIALTTWAHQLVLDVISGVVEVEWADTSTRLRGLYRGGTRLYPL